MEIVKFVALFVALYFSYVNTVRACNRVNVPVINLILQFGGITMFAFLQFHL